MGKEILIFTMVLFMAGSIIGFGIGKATYKLAVVKNCLKSQISEHTCRQYTDIIEHGE